MRQPTGKQFHDTALLEFVYGLPSPKPVAEPLPRPVPSEPALLLLWVSVGLLSTLYAKGMAA
jgi:hypothetical protein